VICGNSQRLELFAQVFEGCLQCRLYFDEMFQDENSPDDPLAIYIVEKKAT
jgi:hypothetical protein